MPPPGVDLLDNTPILDIKPYIPYADCLPSATASSNPYAIPFWSHPSVALSQYALSSEDQNLQTI